MPEIVVMVTPGIELVSATSFSVHDSKGDELRTMHTEVAVLTSIASGFILVVKV